MLDELLEELDLLLEEEDFELELDEDELLLDELLDELDWGLHPSVTLATVGVPSYHTEPVMPEPLTCNMVCVPGVLNGEV